MATVITSAVHPRVKHLIRLRQRRHRGRSGTFLIEGYREVRRAFGAGVVLQEVYFCPALFLVGNEWALLDATAAAGAALVELADAPFRRVSARDRPEGVLGVARRIDADIERLRLPTNPLVLVAVGIQKPGNLGAMLRTAAAAAVDAVLVADAVTDVFGPNVVRASLGALFDLPLAECSSGEAIAWLRAHGLRIVATTPTPTAAVHWAIAFDRPTAVVVGSEQHGLSEEWLAHADQRAIVPMPGTGADSLNAAAATAVVLYEALRQRIC